MDSIQTFDGRLPSDQKLWMSQDFTRLWGYLKRLLVTEPLGLTGVEVVLKVIRTWIDCDALLFLGRSTSAECKHKDKWRTLACVSATSVSFDYAALAEDTHFRELAEKIIKDAKAGDSQKAVPIGDWQAPWMTQRQEWDEAKKNIKQWPELKEGFPKLARVCAGLLGHTVIGKDSVGETFLVGVNEDREGRRGGDLSAERMELGYIALCIYLAEICAHYHRKKRVDSAAPILREVILKDRHDRHAYIRSVCRLGREIEQEDIGQTVRILAEIEQKEPSDSDGEAPPENYRVVDARKALEKSGYAAATDLAQKPEQEQESKRRKAALGPMHEWAKVLLEVQEALKKDDKRSSEGR